MPVGHGFGLAAGLPPGALRSTNSESPVTCLTAATLVLRSSYGFN
jgi:hypothetical protein